MASRRKKIELPFSKVLTELLKEKGLTIRQAAAAAGISPSVLMDWKTGGSPADLMAVQRLAKALQVSFSFLLTGVDEERQDRPPSISEVFVIGEEIIGGPCLLSIRKLVPRSEVENLGASKIKNRRKAK